MPTLQKRRLLRTFGTLAATGAFAGCLDSPAEASDDQSDNRLRDNGVVDYPAMVGGEASVLGNERTIEYETPEATFQLESEVRDESDLHVGRDLSGESMAGFIAPVASGDDGVFEFHVFVNEAFVEFADWNVVVVTPDSEPETRDAADFEHLEGGVYGTVVEPGEIEILLVIDATAEQLQGQGGYEVSGIGILRDPGGGVQTTAPNVVFGFEYDAGQERLRVRHEGGDGVEAAELHFDSDGDHEVVDDFDGTVRAGDVAILSIPPDAMVRVVWEAGDGDQSTTLARWDGPDA